MQRAIAALMMILVGGFVLAGGGRGTPSDPPRVEGPFDVRAIERPRILPAANRLLAEAPVTVTASRSPRSAGGPHDFFSEGDYWWADPANPGGPYIQRDGLSNPNNFVEHRRAMVRLATSVGTLVSAYRLTGDEQYAAHALRHLRAWFVDEPTRMAPHLRYAQAIQGRATGRGTGIIDTIHLVEVARAARLLFQTSRSVTPSDREGVTKWFSDYLVWLTTHEYGIAERDAKNNHATCWVMQVAAFADLTGNRALLDSCRDRFVRVLVPGQMAADGSFPLELARTKPYGYSLFNLDAFATICQILSDASALAGQAVQPPATGRRSASAQAAQPPMIGRSTASAPLTADNLWTWTMADGRGMRRAMAFLYPYMLDKSKWPFARDVLYFEEWPVRQPSLLFGGLALGEPRYLRLWESLNPSPTTEEVIRNLPIRHPVLWVG